MSLVLTVSTPAVAGQWWDTVAPPVVHGHRVPGAWWQAAKRGAARHNTDPFRIIAAGAIESNVAKHGWYDGWVARSRKYVAPMGYNVACSQSRGGRVPDAVIWNPELQIEWAGRLLCGDLNRRLGKYNEFPDRDNYRDHVKRLARKLEWEARRLCQKP